MKKERSSFTSRLGFVLAAAGSAVGLGNLWRFPYLAAKYGGGTFLLVYIILAITFGFTLMIAEIAIGRNTRLSCIGAYRKLDQRFGFLGWLASLVPVIITPYYCVIGGWVVKYLVEFVTGNGLQAAGDSYFASFTAAQLPGVFNSPVIWFVLYVLLNAVVVLFGVEKGIEKVSRVMMPVLVILSIIVAVFSLTMEGALEGLKFYIVPDFSNFSGKTVLAAMGQMFYSMSLAMGIMITYGSYMKKDASISGAARQISICDTCFAIVAALIVIPSIFAFSPDPETAAAQSGPSLMFVQLPAVFAEIPGGRWIGAVFFLLVFFAALTSSISLVEAIVAVLRENCRLSRRTACIIVFGIMLVLGSLSSLGFGPLSMIKIGDMDILTIFDYFSNSILMPLVAIGTCIIAGFFTDTNGLMDEIGMRRSWYRRYYRVMIRYVAPLCMAAIMISGIFLDL